MEFLVKCFLPIGVSDTIFEVCYYIYNDGKIYFMKLVLKEIL